MEAPSGTLALLFTDIEGSTRLARALGPGWRGPRRHREYLARGRAVAAGRRVASACALALAPAVT